MVELGRQALTDVRANDGARIILTIAEFIWTRPKPRTAGAPGAAALSKWMPKLRTAR